MSEHNEEKKPDINMEERLTEIFGGTSNDEVENKSSSEKNDGMPNMFKSITSMMGTHALTEIGKVALDREMKLVDELKKDLANIDDGSLFGVSKASAAIKKTADKIKAIHTVKTLVTSVTSNGMFGSKMKTSEEVFERFLDSETGNGLAMMKDLLSMFGGEDGVDN